MIMRPTFVHCLFEQSGTFKNAFRQLIQNFGLFNILNSPTVQFRKNFGLFSQFLANFSAKKTRFFDTGYRFGAHPTPIFKH